MSKNADIEEEMEEEEDPAFNSKKRRDSENFKMPDLSDLDKSRLLSCIEEIRNIIGEVHSDQKLTEVIIANNYDFNKALDTLLKSSDSQPFKQETVEKGR
jgi:elongation factor 1 alpha-like protein